MPRPVTAQRFSGLVGAETLLVAGLKSQSTPLLAYIFKCSFSTGKVVVEEVLQMQVKELLHSPRFNM